MTDDSVRVTHTLNGRTQPDDQATRGELTHFYLRVIRRTAVGAERRVRRIIARAGVNGLFDEPAHLEGSRAISRYLADMTKSRIIGISRRIYQGTQSW